MYFAKLFLERGTPSENIMNSCIISSPMLTDLKSSVKIVLPFFIIFRVFVTLTVLAFNIKIKRYYDNFENKILLLKASFEYKIFSFKILPLFTTENCF
jgi:hypothetical protein